MMQKQLLEMTDIPVQIQSKIAMVTKALEQFMTMDPDALESSWQRASIEREESAESSSEKQFSSIPEEENEEENNNEENSESFDHFETEHSTRETSFSLDDFGQQYDKLEDKDDAADVGKSDDEYDDDEKSICESVKSEETLKLETEKRRKNEKILKLEKSWLKLAQVGKTIHK